jgi:hypothetical protein
LASNSTRDAEFRSLASKPSSKSVKKKKRIRLPEWYGEDLDLRLVNRSGRLILAKVVNDPPRYWFVWIHNFNLRRDKASGAKTIGVWRFTEKDVARIKFEQLLPLYPASKRKGASPEQMARVRATRKAISCVKKPQNPWINQPQLPLGISG